MRDTSKMSRRQVLAAATVTAGAAAARTAQAKDEPGATAEPTDRRDVRLQDTGHIRTYYALARR